MPRGCPTGLMSALETQVRSHEIYKTQLTRPIRIAISYHILPSSFNNMKAGGGLASYYSR
jgi:hypothetical protein